MPAEEEPTATASIVPECLSNPTLGAAANGVFLDVMEAQVIENRRAEIEGRNAQIAKRDFRHPAWIRPDAGSLYEDVSFGTHFDDGEPVNSPQGGPEVPSSGMMAAARKSLNRPLGRSSKPVKAATGESVQVAPSTPQKAPQTLSQASGGDE